MATKLRTKLQLFKPLCLYIDACSKKISQCEREREKSLQERGLSDRSLQQEREGESLLQVSQFCFHFSPVVYVIMCQLGAHELIALISLTAMLLIIGRNNFVSDGSCARQLTKKCNCWRQQPTKDSKKWEKTSKHFRIVFQKSKLV